MSTKSTSGGGSDSDESIDDSLDDILMQANSDEEPSPVASSESDQPTADGVGRDATGAVASADTLPFQVSGAPAATTDKVEVEDEIPVDMTFAPDAAALPVAADAIESEAEVGDGTREPVSPLPRPSVTEEPEETTPTIAPASLQHDAAAVVASEAPSGTTPDRDRASQAMALPVFGGSKPDAVKDDDDGATFDRDPQREPVSLPSSPSSKQPPAGFAALGSTLPGPPPGTRAVPGASRARLPTPAGGRRSPTLPGMAALGGSTLASVEAGASAVEAPLIRPSLTLQTAGASSSISELRTPLPLLSGVGHGINMAVWQFVVVVVAATVVGAGAALALRPQPAPVVLPPGYVLQGGRIAGPEIRPQPGVPGSAAAVAPVNQQGATGVGPTDQFPGVGVPGAPAKGTSRPGRGGGRKRDIFANSPSTPASEPAAEPAKPKRTEGKSSGKKDGEWVDPFGQ